MSLPADILLPVGYKSFGMIDSKFGYNANWDISWSFSYALTGAEHGFCTFLSTSATLSGANPGQYLGYFESGGVLAIAFDSTGYFALSNTQTLEGVNTSEVKPNSLIVRDSNNVVMLNESLTALDTSFILASSTKTYKTLRFKYINSGRKLYVDYKNDSDLYTNLTTLTLTSNNIVDDTILYPGVTFCSPVSSSATDTSTLFVTNFHVHGNINPPTYETLDFTPLSTSSVTLYTTISGISANLV
tara:strand:+ start:22505 stop:23236 length:732 start_codon:yes stop_codon:yes gene_type:complete